MQSRWGVFVLDFWGLVLLAFFRRLGSGGKPGAFGDPEVAGLSGLRDGEQALRHAGAKSFIDHAEVKRHGHGSTFITAGIEKLAVDHDRHWDQVRFAVGKKLDQSHCSWSFGNPPAAVLRDGALRRQRNASQQGDGSQQGAI